MASNIFGIILAGGKGSRMGNAERPKQFLEIGGRPIIIHTVEKFVVNNAFEKIIVLCPKAWIEHTRDLIRKHIPMNERVVVIEGGASRNETLMNAIRYIEENHCLDEDTIIVTHDSVRPFVTRRMIDENIEAAQKYGACDTVIPASDTIVESRNHEVINQIPDRAYLYQGQTPQSFHALKLKKIYESLTEEEKAILTDACKIYVIKGEPVHLVEGDVSNIKITYPADIRIAESLIGGK